MEKVGGGSVINVASIGALVSGPADGGDTAYSASKGGLTSVTRNAAIALADKKIRVNSLHPGGIMTPMLEEVFNAMPDLWESNKLASRCHLIFPTRLTLPAERSIWRAIFPKLSREQNLS